MTLMMDVQGQAEEAAEAPQEDPGGLLMQQMASLFTVGNFPLFLSKSVPERFGKFKIICQKHLN